MKKCKFCEAQVDVDAAKCKHCGESFACNGNFSTDIASVEPLNQNVIWQDFSGSAGVTIISVALSLLRDFFAIEDVSESPKIIIWHTAAIIYFTICFRDYLKNVNEQKAVTMLNLKIIFILIIGVIEMAVTGKSISRSEGTAMAFFALIDGILISIVDFKVGLSLQKVKNDYVGLLRELGIAMVVVAPVALLSVILGSLMENKLIIFLGSALSIIPDCIVIAIFLRARKICNAAAAVMPLNEKAFTQVDENLIPAYKPILHEDSEFSSAEMGNLEIGVESQPLLLPLEKIYISVDNVDLPTVLKFGDRKIVQVHAGKRLIKAELRIWLLKRKSNVLILDMKPSETSGVFLEYDNLTGGIKLIPRSDF